MSLLVILLLTFLALVAGECDVYDTQSNIDRCRKVQDCVNAAFFNNRNNLYILDAIFRSTKQRPPIALVVNYNVTIINNYINGSGSSSGSLSNFTVGSGSGEDLIQFDEGSEDRNNETTMPWPEDDGNKVKIIQYNEQLGWTACGIYTTISPMFLISLQPKIFVTLMSFINENFNLTKSIHLEIKLESTTECNLPKDTTPSEVKGALEYLTMNVSTK